MTTTKGHIPHAEVDPLGWYRHHGIRLFPGCHRQPNFGVQRRDRESQEAPQRAHPAFTTGDIVQVRTAGAAEWQAAARRDPRWDAAAIIAIALSYLAVATLGAMAIFPPTREVLAAIGRSLL